MLISAYRCRRGAYFSVFTLSFFPIRPYLWYGFDFSQFYYQQYRKRYLILHCPCKVKIDGKTCYTKNWMPPAIHRSLAKTSKAVWTLRKKNRVSVIFCILSHVKSFKLHWAHHERTRIYNYTCVIAWLLAQKWLFFPSEWLDGSSSGWRIYRNVFDTRSLYLLLGKVSDHKHSHKAF